MARAKEHYYEPERLETIRIKLRGPFSGEPWVHEPETRTLDDLQPQKPKEPPMSDLASTILALQIMSGIGVYRIRIAGASRASYIYKSSIELEPGDAVLLSNTKSFVAGIVESKEEIYDYDKISDCQWVLFKIENPETKAEALETMDVQAKQKLMQAKALTAAKQLLEASGLSLEDMQKLFLAKP